MGKTRDVKLGQDDLAMGKGNIYVGPPPKDHAEALRIYRRVLV